MSDNAPYPWWEPTPSQVRVLQLLSEVWQDRDRGPLERAHGASLRVLQEKGMAEYRVDETRRIGDGARMWRLTRRGLQVKRQRVGGGA